MSSCIPYTFWSKSRKSRTYRKRRSATIEVKASTADGTDIWRAAVLSFDETTSENVVSRRLVTEILDKPIYPIQKEMRSASQTTKDVDGYTELVWCQENSSRRIHTALFFVSSEYSPRYDMVLGKDGIKQMDTSKSSKTAR